MKNLVYLIVLAGLIAGVHYFDGCFAKKEKAPEVQYVNPLTDTVKHYKDLYGNAWAQVQEEVNSHSAIDVIHKQMIDSLLRSCHLKDKQLQGMSKVIAQAQGSFTAPLQPVNEPEHIAGAGTVGNSDNTTEPGAKSFEWHDQWTEILGVVYADSINVNYSMNLSFTTASFWHRKHTIPIVNIEWGKKIYFFSASCDNKNVMITGLKAIKIN